MKLRSLDDLAGKGDGDGLVKGPDQGEVVHRRPDKVGGIARHGLHGAAAAEVLIAGARAKEQLAALFHIGA